MSGGPWPDEVGEAVTCGCGAWDPLPMGKSHAEVFAGLLHKPGCTRDVHREERLVRAMAAMLAHEDARAIWEPPFEGEELEKLKRYEEELAKVGLEALRGGGA